MSLETVSNLYERHGNIGLNRRFNISLKHRYVYSAVAKVGTTSLNHIFQKMEMRELNRKWIDFHPVVENSPFIKPYQLSRTQLADILFGEDFFRFLFVRDPFRRAVSAWRDKINGNRQEKKQILKTLKIDGSQLQTSVSFYDFLSAVADIHDEKRDEHWATQTYLSCAGAVPYGFIGRIESFDHDIKSIEKKLMLDLSGYYPPETMKNTIDDKRAYTEDYCEKTIDLVRQIYAEDFKQFHYPTSL